MVYERIMNITPTSPEPDAAPQVALRLAELVARIVESIGGGAWWWCFLPGGRALRLWLRTFSRDFTALMQRIAAGLPPQEDPAAPAPIPRSPDRARPPAHREAAPAHPRRDSAHRAPMAAAPLPRDPSVTPRNPPARVPRLAFIARDFAPRWRPAPVPFCKRDPAGGETRALFVADS